ncbi:MAG: DeoR/GlpR family DNA-binding transcription regulator [Actinomycetota bacterium]|nr:DeoR/GlpR family DNA-binding transcription regulator [Actinomycetota bacterium]
MKKKDRLDKLKTTIIEKGFITIQNLKKETDIPTSTLRRDLLDLEKIGLIERWHGGATSLDYARPSFESRLNINREKKEEIARKAAELIKDNQIIIIDSGSTSSMLARNIREVKKLTVITPSIYIARQLSNVKNVVVILTGGKLHLDTNSLIGPLAEKTIEEIHANIAFMACDSISSEMNVMITSFELANLKMKLLMKAEYKVLIADSTKFSKINISSIGSISIFDKVIVDSNLPENLYKKITDLGVEVI